MTTCRNCGESIFEATPKANWIQRADLCGNRCLREFLRPYVPGELKERGFPRRFWGANLQNLNGLTERQRAVDEELRSYICKVPKRGLLLLGPVGVGKSYRAAAVHGELSLFGQRIAYSTSKEFIERAQDLYRNEKLHQGGTQESLRADLLSCDSLHFDDLGSEKITDFTGAQLDALIDHVYRERAPRLVVTTNLTLNELGDQLPRVTDRLVEICEILAMDGTSRRLKGDQATEYRLFYDPDHCGSRTAATVSSFWSTLRFPEHYRRVEVDKFETKFGQ